MHLVQKASYQSNFFAPIQFSVTQKSQKRYFYTVSFVQNWHVFLKRDWLLRSSVREGGAMTTQTSATQVALHMNCNFGAVAHTLNQTWLALGVIH
jgi:hypothetical protein